MADTSGGSFTVTLPASPTSGDYVAIVDAGNYFAVNALTVARNGSTIDGSATDLVINITNAKVEFIYSGTTWEVATSTGTRGYSGSLGSTGYTGSVGYTGSIGIGYTGSIGAAYGQSASPVSNATGIAGQLAYDTSYLYVCVATNTWKRISLGSY
jgi:hypothetical protein